MLLVHFVLDNESHGNVCSGENECNIVNVANGSASGEVDFLESSLNVNASSNYCCQLVLENSLVQSGIGQHEADVQSTTHMEDVSNQQAESDEILGVPETPSNRQPCNESIDENEDGELIARARAVGIAYEFASPGSTESHGDARRRRRRNQRRILQGERRLLHRRHQDQVNMKMNVMLPFEHLKSSK